MNLLENIKSINKLIDEHQERFQFFIKMANAFKADTNLIDNNTFTDKFVFTHQTFQIIAKFLDLNFENENASNVCFANNKDLRSEFKDNFSAEDVLNCLVAIMNLENENSSMHANSLSTLLKRDNTAEIQKTFWNLVKRGIKIRNIDS